MTVTLLDWKPESKEFIDEFQKSILSNGFVRLCNLWNEEEKIIVDKWYQTVEDWFLTSKEKESYKADNHKQGWIPKESSIINPYRKKDWKETFEFDDLVTYENTPKLLEDDVEKVVTLVHSKALEAVRVFEKILKIEENYLVNLHDNMENSHLRLAYYAKSDKRKNQLPMSEHKDYNSITLIFSPDPHKKLQIEDLNGTWHDIDYVEDSCVCQIGNCMQILTHDYLKSSFHRVLFNNKEDAFTTAYFLNLPKDYLMTHLGPNPKKYDDMTVGEFTEKFHRTKNSIRKRNLKK